MGWKLLPVCKEGGDPLSSLPHGLGSCPPPFPTPPTPCPADPVQSPVAQIWVHPDQAEEMGDRRPFLGSVLEFPCIASYS